MINDTDPTTDMTPQPNDETTKRRDKAHDGSVIKDDVHDGSVIKDNVHDGSVTHDRPATSDTKNTPKPERKHETIPASASASARDFKPKERTPPEIKDTPLWPEEEMKKASPEDDLEDSELSKLRCGSLCTEELVEKEKQKQLRRNRTNRCPDYPGLAFGSAMFGSDTSMKFNIIKNELHNIMKSQLRRVEGEVNALSNRVKQLDKNLEESEFYIRTATITLAEAVAIQIEEAKNSNHDEDEDNNPLSAFDRQVAFLEGQLKGARVLARKSFLILEDCDLEQEQISNKMIAAGIPANIILDNNPSQTRLTSDLENSTEQNLNIQNIANNNNNNVDCYDNKKDIGNTNNDDLANANLPTISSQ